MNNEEKILAILETMQLDIGTIQADIGAIQADIGTIHADIETIQSDIVELKQGQASLTRDVQGLREAVIVIEHDYLKKIQAAFEGADLAKDLIQDIRPRIEHLEYVTENHSVELMIHAKKLADA